jgi:hypothetical protein
MPVFEFPMVFPAGGATLVWILRGRFKAQHGPVEVFP